jgi:hypothetical protein
MRAAKNPSSSSRFIASPPLQLLRKSPRRRGHFVQFAEIVFHHSVIEANHNLMLDRIYPLNGSHISVEHFLVIVVLRLDDLVPYLEAPTEPLNKRLTGLSRIQRPLQGCVQFPDAERSPVHRAENLHIADRV